MTTVTVAPADAVDVRLVPSGAESTLTAPPGATEAITVIPAQRRSPVVPRRVSSVRHRLVALAIPRLPLLAILLAVSVVSARLMMTNTAFLDEASYLSAGHVLWHNWMHGGPDMKYSSYFSGSPEIYPLIAAAANAVGGLALARLLSLGFVLVTICLLYATTGRLFDRRAATWAAAIFATVEGTQFLAALATYDAMALMLTALATWLAVRYAQSERAYPHAALFLGAPVLALANATKYATGLFDPAVVAIVGLVVAAHYGWRQGLRCTMVFAAMLAATLAAALAIAGHDFESGVLVTTLNRADGVTPAGVVLGDAVHWVGAAAALAVVAAVVAWAQASRRRLGAGRTSRRVTALLITVLAATAFLAPLEQARIHTTVSLAKHVAFGGWFAAIAGGWLLAQITGARLRAAWRWVPVVVLVGGLAVAGRAQAANEYNHWPNSTQLMAGLRPYIAATDKPVLLDDAEVAGYYLGADLPPTRWSDTYFYAYTPPGSTTSLTGLAAYRSAIAGNHFGVVALDFGLTADTDKSIKADIERNPNYHYVGRVFVHDDYAHFAYSVWVNITPETAR